MNTATQENGVSVAGNALERAAAHYANRFDAQPLPVARPPAPELELVLTIPAHDEPALGETLESVARCQQPRAGGAVEVIVFINAPEDTAADVHERNQAAYARAQQLATALAQPWLGFHICLDNAVTAAAAGVGLARKRLMDTALTRLATAGAERGVIAALDADCTIDANYLQKLAEAFDERKSLAGASLYFEHDLDDATTGPAITYYELYLRHYRLGLAYAGSPFAFHTVGSSMAVNALDYARLGGMNRKQAGEDFYFLQKFMATGRFCSIDTTCVRPSSRPSHRVPFGTGAAIAKDVAAGQRMTFYDVRVFDALKDFYDTVTGDGHTRWSHEGDAVIESFAEPLRAFLSAQAFTQRLQQIKRNAASPETVARHVRDWMNGFRCMKFARFATEHYYGPAEATETTGALIERLTGASVEGARSERALLEQLRELDRQS